MFNSLRAALLALFALLLSACEPREAASNASTTNQSADPKAPALARALAEADSPSAAVQQHLQLLQQSQTRGERALELSDLNPAQAKAQTLALAHPVFLQQVQRKDGQIVRVEVQSIYPLRESDMTESYAGCRASECLRVDLFDFGQNRMLSAVVDVRKDRVLSWRGLSGVMPELSPRLKRLAVEIARAAPEVIEALGGMQPAAADAIMADTKTALNGTRCERSQHLCVAPTFVQGNIAIWAIVDLSALKLVGVQWTAHGQDGPLEQALVPSEQSLSDAVIMQRHCEVNTALERMGWRLKYMLTASDGLQISEVYYKNELLLESAKLVDWHVNYSNREGFGYADAVGCPNFSSAAVIPFAAPEVVALREKDEVVGFVLQQDYRSQGWPGPCNYSYRQRFAFYADGRFRPTAGSLGAGCGDDGTYRPILRIEPAGKDWQLKAFSPESQSFDLITEERWFDSNGAVDSRGARFQLQRGEQRWDVLPSRGQFENSRGDFEYVYVTAKPTLDQPDEGRTELPTLGSCCNTDHRQGPETFINAQPLDQGLVLWYVPQLKNDLQPSKEYCWAKPTLKQGALAFDVFPCEGGPMFQPGTQP